MWWIDFSETTYIGVPMQGCLSCRESSNGEIYIYVADNKTVEV